jgi:adenosylcobinamide-GDP ribazoletransferase
MPAPVVAFAAVALLGYAVGLAAAVNASLVAWAVAPAGALLVAAACRWHITRRLGGVTGDVFGALVELGTVLTLIGLAFG